MPVICSLPLTFVKLLEKRKRLAQPRQAQVEPAERLFFNLLDGLACDLEGLGAGAGQRKRTG
ncbi:hypothetical protein AA980_14490 [Neobacillus vireti]|nr:hypothetical protein AA980_14490 [Neobacillus vireti]